MAQFDVYRNANPASRARIHCILDVQSDLLNPLFAVEGREVAMLTPEIAGVPAKLLGEVIGNLSTQRGAIIAALDLVITGI